MYIAIYITVIALVCIGIILFFVLKNKKDKKILHEIKNKEKAENVLKEVSLMEIQKQNEKKEEIQQIKNEAQFEDFSLDEKKEKNTLNNTLEETTIFKKREFVNPFDFDFDDDEEEDLEEDDKFIDEKFEEYENFLKKNMDENQVSKPDFEVDDDLEDLDAIANFDFNSIKGKNESEITEIIKTLPPKAQELLLTEILTRKNYDDKED